MDERPINRIRRVRQSLLEYANALRHHGCAPLPPAYPDGLKYLASELQKAINELLGKNTNS